MMTNMTVIKTNKKKRRPSFRGTRTGAAPCTFLLGPFLSVVALTLLTGGGRTTSPLLFLQVHAQGSIACDLCQSPLAEISYVPPENQQKLVQLTLFGPQPCGGLYEAAKNPIGLFTSINTCQSVRNEFAPVCCTGTSGPVDIDSTPIPPTTSPTLSPVIVDIVGSTPTNPPTDDSVSTVPSDTPSMAPSSSPSDGNLRGSTLSPTTPPTRRPTVPPTTQATSPLPISDQPTATPTRRPTPQPTTAAPTKFPTLQPNAKSQTTGPTRRPTPQPTIVSPTLAPVPLFIPFCNICSNGGTVTKPNAVLGVRGLSCGDTDVLGRNGRLTVVECFQAQVGDTPCQCTVESKGTGADATSTPEMMNPTPAPRPSPSPPTVAPVTQTVAPVPPTVAPVTPTVAPLPSTPKPSPSPPTPSPPPTPGTTSGAAGAGNFPPGTAPNSDGSFGSWVGNSVAACELLIPGGFPGAGTTDINCEGYYNLSCLFAGPVSPSQFQCVCPRSPTVFICREPQML
mmetsp:Transcript_57003/g.138854  ORF Transcript_57003/g.138854 Transcript_57003/m.138854 type:complete len:508 (-) Transcript_57003:100-1623(-)